MESECDRELPLGPESFQRERHGWFGRCWMPLGSAAALAEPGAYVARNLGGWPLFVVRGEDGGLAAFRNTCRHQQMPVLDNGAGRCERIRCRYHGWTYGLDGRFLQAPDPVAPPPGEEATLGLFPVAQALWGDVILACCEEGKPPPAPPAEAPLAGLGAPLGTAEVSSNADWKLCLEAWLAGEPGRVTRSGEGWSLAQAADGLRLWLWPALGLSFAADHRLALLVTPRSFRKTELRLLAYAEPGAPVAAAKQALSAAVERLQQVAATAEAGVAGLPLTPLRTAFRAAARQVHAAAQAGS